MPQAGRLASLVVKRDKGSDSFGSRVANISGQHQQRRHRTKRSAG
jgi:hypothetical protein